VISESDLLSRFENVRRSGDDGWMARCPAHEDPNPSLHITRADDRWLLHCHAGCSFDAVTAEAGIDPKDLFEDRQRSKIVATYDYTDESDALMFQVCRKVPKNFVQRRPDGNGGWIWKLGSTRRVLYRLLSALRALHRRVAARRGPCAALDRLAGANPPG
jgi:putative DNA primase/helicase